MENPGGLDKQSSRQNGKYGRMEYVMEKTVCFDFRIIEQSDGSQIIDTGMKTPMDALMPEMQTEYLEVHNQIAIMERMARKARREAEQQRKNSRGLLYKAACLFGLA